MTKEKIMQRVKEEEEELDEESDGEEKDESDNNEDEDSESDNDNESQDSNDTDNEDDNNVPSELRRQRWFSDPLFADLSQGEESESDDEAAIAGMKQYKSQKRELPLEERLKAYSNNPS